MTSVSFMVRCVHVRPITHPPRPRTLPRARTALGFMAFGWWLILSPQVSAAGGERIKRVEVLQEDGRLLVSAELSPGLASQTEEDIRNGISKDLYYYIVLKRRQRLWYDEEQESVTIKYGIKLNLLKQEYTVTTRLPSGTSTTVVKDLDSVRSIVSRFERVPITTSSQLERRKSYLVSVKAEMRAPKLPLYLDYLLFFIPFLEVDTPWANSAPFRAPDGR